MRAKVLAFLAFAALAAIPVRSWGFELQLEGGQCRLRVVHSDTFQNTDMHTDNYMRPDCGTVALANLWPTSHHFGWRVGFKVIGEIQARDNEAVNDEQAHHHAGTCTPPRTFGCTIRFNGVGRTFGISTGLTGELPLTSRFKLVGEGGLFFFQHHFKADGTFPTCPNCEHNRRIAYNETSKISSEPSPYLGLSLRWRDLYFAARHYWPTGHRTLSLWETGQMNEFVIGAAISFR